MHAFATCNLDFTCWVWPMTAQAQTTQRQYQLQKTGDAPPVLKLVEAPVRQPDEHEVLVRVRAVSLNRRDIYVRLGRYPGPMRTESRATLGWRRRSRRHRHKGHALQQGRPRRVDFLPAVAGGAVQA